MNETCIYMYFTFTHKSQFTNSRTQISNFTLTHASHFIHSRVKKKSISRFHNRKKGHSRVYADHWEAPLCNSFLTVKYGFSTDNSF